MGFGRIGYRHAQLLKNSSIYELVGIADIDPIRRNLANKDFGEIVFDSTQKMIQRTSPDILVICTESGNHYSNTIENASLVKNIVVEKPMALRIDDAREMIDKCELVGTNLFVVKQNRYNLPIVKTKEIFENKSFGRLTLVTIRVRWCRDQNYYNLDDWRGTWKYDGGVIANQASHHIDLLQMFMGEIDSVFAYGSTLLTDIETEETMICLLKARNGSLGIIEATNTARPKNLEGSLSILGEKGSVVVGGDSMNQFISVNIAGLSEVNFIEFEENPPDVYGFGHQKFYVELDRFLTGKKYNLVMGREAYKTVELINAIYQSFEKHKEVDLPLLIYEGKLGI